jgi:hypothetical protein
MSIQHRQFEIHGSGCPRIGNEKGEMYEAVVVEVLVVSDLLLRGFAGDRSTG